MSSNRPFVRAHCQRHRGVYLFVVGDVVQYVGSAQKSLHSRMRSYERRQHDPNQIGQFILH
jgi:excinuclease UvrABC nuclease subunit